MTAAALAHVGPWTEAADVALVAEGGALRLTDPFTVTLTTADLIRRRAGRP